ncbi:MAG: UvrD-helicase domain-containing protein [bacterium]
MKTNLNERQHEASIHKDGPLMILAGAGAGKTKTITSRIAELIKTGVAPEAILAITFTNKAAKEMRERVTAILSNDPDLNRPVSMRERPFVSTFHSLGVHILKENAHLLGLTRNFTIFDRDDSKRAVKAGIVANGLDPKQFEPAKLLSIISREKGNGMTFQTFKDNAGRDYMRNIVANVWEHYESRLKKEKALDFDDLLLKTMILLRDNEAVRNRYQKTWQYIHVDEYQDTNEVQYKLARFLLDNKRNLCVVGDIDQMIYTFRGANIENILNFENDYPDAKIVLLEQNYRSTKIILGAANNIIKKNKNRREKNMFTENAEGEKVSLYTAYDENDEARYIARTSQELFEQGVKPEQIAVLYRTNFQSRAIEEAFLTYGIAYELIGTRFFERKEVKDILSFIRFALNPESLSDLTRIVNVPPRGIGKVTLLKIIEGKEHELGGKAGESVASFRRFISKLQAELASKKPSDVVKFILKESGIETYLMKEGDEGLERLQNIKELVTLALKYDAMTQGEGIEKMLEETALASDQDEVDEKKPAVKLMTIHASKGLEFDYVFVTGLEEGLFPSRRDGEEKDEEEERRLMYVAVTRAGKKVFLSCASVRTIFGEKRMGIPSEFIGDIGDEHFEEVPEKPERKKREYLIDF